MREVHAYKIHAFSALLFKNVCCEATAKSIRAEGDAEAAKYYEVFKENPELAVFLRKLDSLRRIMKGRTTLVLDTNAAPFDLLKPGAEKLKPVVGPVAR